MSYSNTHTHSMHSLYLAMSIAGILILFLMLVAFYPPVMVIALDISVIAGGLLIVTILANIWKHEIDRIGKLFKNLNTQGLAEPQQEEYESYQILKSTAQSIQTMQNQPIIGKDDKRRLRYLKRQQTVNSFRLVGHASLWIIRLFSPFKKSGYPTFFDNVRTIFSNPKFLALRVAILIWFLFSLLTMAYISLI
ncbi:MAG: hypothetical protein HOE80_04620 [Candidatus Magasanikbacteria bacterium]|jgi:hypothetical protein|nr:hypothetical protein [Candidatus Magasanikbacteria bacterium]MBT4071975.1 hypothetical protein [Candidatus Magasanikbacteria bacterium]